MAKELNNYIPINRRIFEHALWTEDRPKSKFEAWIDLIRSARFEDGEASALIGGRIVKWNRGEFPASLRFLAERWKWSKNKVDDFIKLLENDGMIARRTAKGTSQNIITLCNYDSYNINGKIKGQQKGQAGDSEGTAEGQVGDKIKKVNKEKKEEDIPTPTRIFSDQEKESFVKFQNWILNNAPRVAQMDEPFTIEQYLSPRIRQHNADELKLLLEQMHNWKDLLKKNVSAYKTLLTWQRRELQKN